MSTLDASTTVYPAISAVLRSTSVIQVAGNWNTGSVVGIPLRVTRLLVAFMASE